MVKSSAGGPPAALPGADVWADLVTGCLCPLSPRVESVLGRCAHRVLGDAMLDVMVKGTSYPPMLTKSP